LTSSRQREDFDLLHGVILDVVRHQDSRLLFCHCGDQGVGRRQNRPLASEVVAIYPGLSHRAAAHLPEAERGEELIPERALSWRYPGVELGRIDGAHTNLVARVDHLQNAGAGRLAVLREVNQGGGIEQVASHRSSKAWSRSAS